MQITVTETILTGNLGDGWKNTRETARALFDFALPRYEKTIRDEYPDAEIEIRCDIENATGIGGGFHVYAKCETPDLEHQVENRLLELLPYDSQTAWEEFCASDEAANLAE